MTPIALVISRLRHLERRCDGGPHKYNCQCPVHDDNTPSMMVASGGDGIVVIKCMAGCDTGAIVARLGLVWKDLYPDTGDDWTPQRKTKPVVAETRVRRDIARLMEACRFPSADQIESLAETVRSRPSRLASVIRLMDIGIAEGEVLQKMYARWRGEPPEWAWAFGERCGDGKIVGISLRSCDGQKSSAKNASRGLLLGPRYGGEVFCPEGATDTLTLACAGIAAIGRPGCNSGIPHLAKLLGGRDAVVVGDWDAQVNRLGQALEPGRGGAEKTATVIGCRWSMPEWGFKDVRSWASALPGLDIENQDALSIPLSLLASSSTSLALS